MWRLASATLALLALAPTATASAACPGAGSAPAQLDARARAKSVVCLLNAERATHGVRALRRGARLTRAARGHSAEMVSERYFQHASRSGASFVSRIAATGWMRGRARWKVGENLAWGTGARATPEAIVAAWMASPPHRETLLDPAYRLAGVGVSLGVPSGDTDGATYTVDFGSADVS
jgi:uncharacterized protein YkwD